MVSFSSSDESIATVDENGYINRISAGTVEITATAGSGITAAWSVVVNGFALVMNLPDNLTTIESEAFIGLDTVEAVRTSESVIEISDDVFNDGIIILAPVEAMRHSGQKSMDLL